MEARPNDNSMRVRLAKWLWKWRPHPTQEQWLLAAAKTKVAACGRRWGKTEAAAIDVLTAAVMRQGCVQIVVSPTYDQSRLIFDSAERLALNSGVTRSVAKVVRTPYPRLSIGRSLIMARTADEDGRNLRGHSADRVIVDEAAYVRDALVQEVISPMLADRDGELVMISTPFGKNHFYRAFRRGQGTGSREQVTVADCLSFSFPSCENPHISRDYIERQRTEMSPRQFAVEYEAQFIDDQAAVFPWEDLEAASREPVTGNREQDGMVCVGIDWARYSDYTALVAVANDEAGMRVVGIDRFNSMGWGRQIERVTEFLRSHRACAVLTDQTSIGDPLIEQLRAKAYEIGLETVIDGYTFTNGSKRELIESVAMDFAHRRIAIPRDEVLMKELQYFEYELTQSGGVRMNARSGHHDDLVIALALACRQARSVGAGGAMISRNGRVAAGAW